MPAARKRPARPARPARRTPAAAPPADMDKVRAEGLAALNAVPFPPFGPTDEQLAKWRAEEEASARRDAAARAAAVAFAMEPEARRTRATAIAAELVRGMTTAHVADAANRIAVAAVVLADAVALECVRTDVVHQAALALARPK